MRELQSAHVAAALSANAQTTGAGVLPTRRPGRLNGDGRRPDAYYSPQYRLEQPDVAARAPTPPLPVPARPQRGRRATDQRRTPFPHPSQLATQSPFMAQLMSQGTNTGTGTGTGTEAVADAGRVDAPSAAATAYVRAAANPMVRVGDTDLASAQRRHSERVDAYRKTVTMATHFIVRRYNLATDFQGLILDNARAVEMVV